MRNKFARAAYRRGLAVDRVIRGDRSAAALRWVYLWHIRSIKAS